MSTFIEQVQQYRDAGYPLLYTQTHEEQRVLGDLQQEWPQLLVIWSLTTGWIGHIYGEQGKKETNSLKALENILEMPADALIVFKDFHGAIGNALVVRMLRDLLPHLEKTGKTILFCGPVVTIPVELEKDIVMVDYPLPTRAELAGMLDAVIADATEGVGLEQPERVAAIEGAQSLTYSEARNAFSLALATEGAINAQAVRTILREKAQALKKTNLAEWVEATTLPDSVGGFGNVKRYLETIAPIFWQPEAAERFGLLPEDYPRSIAFCGLPGCGKSEMAKAIAAYFKIGMVKTDWGRIFGSKVGESESNTLKLGELKESLAPIVDWWDEAEKGLAGISGSKENPWEARVGGSILTWFEEFRARILVVATINRQEALPPEMLSRFQKVFFVDLPTEEERRAIFEIHCMKRNMRLITQNLYDIVAGMSVGFSGREIRNAVQLSSQMAFALGKSGVDGDLLMAAIKQITPLSQTRGDELDKIRKWAKDNNVESASAPAQLSEPKAQRRVALAGKK